MFYSWVTKAKGHDFFQKWFKSVIPESWKASREPLRVTETLSLRLEGNQNLGPMSLQGQDVLVLHIWSSGLDDSDGFSTKKSQMLNTFLRMALQGKPLINFYEIKWTLINFYIMIWAPNLALGDEGLTGSPAESWQGKKDNITLFRWLGLF